ncbi:MAG: ABC transporter permease, partial [Acidobacteriota bacterium]
GVAGGGFRGTSGSGWLVDVWTPRSAYALLDGYPLERLWSRDSTLNQDFVARLQHGVTLEAVEEQLNAIIGRLAEADPEHREFLSDLRATLTPGLDSPRVRERMLSTLGAFGGAALLVLLIACANVANLLLVRALQARNELAVRRALGASAARVARRQLVESALLAAAGTIVGLVFAWSVGWMFRGDPFLDFQGLVVDARLLGFAIVAATGTTMLFGAMPAVLAGRFNLEAALRGAARGTTRRDSFARHALSALQIGLSLMLLIGGVLLIRTVRNLYAMEPGIEVENVSTVLIDFGADTPDDESLGVLYRELPKAVSAVPGVQVAAVDGWYGPYRGRPTMAIATLDAPEDATETADMRRVTPDWFAVMGLDPLVGRTLDDADARPSSPPVVVLTSRLAQRLFDSTNVIGRYVRVGRTPVEAEIVGVVGDIRIADVRSEPDEAVFLPLITENMGPVALLARTSAVSPPAPAAIREAVEAMIPNIAVPEPTPLTERIDVQLAEQRVFMRLLGLLSALALVLAAIGLYGVVAFTVAGRKREFGIRMALGADGIRVAGLVSWTAAKIVGSGTILGLAGAYSLSGVIESKLFGVEAIDLASYAAAAALLAAVAVVASGVPALGAARVDPADTLRQE